jgi:hypothetical protein
LQATAGDEVGRAGVLGHVERVLVTHVDHGGANFDAAGLRAGRRQQGEWRGKLAGEMMDPEERAVRAELFGRDSEVDGLQEHVRRRTRLGIRRGRPMPEREETDFLHERPLAMRRKRTGKSRTCQVRLPTPLSSRGAVCGRRRLDLATGMPDRRRHADRRNQIIA